jgi:NAD(P)-dependent dehydrogenase (short-subunit alcohol dehydrogenase family)
VTAVIVTGGSSGLGEAVMRRLGADCVSLDLRRPGWEADFEIVDLAQTSAVERTVERVAERRGGISAVICAAGTDACGTLAEVPSEDWERVIAVNLVGTAAVIRSALPHLVESRGKVVTVASTLGLRALPAATAYCASKFGVIGFSRALAAEMAGTVGVTLLVPGGMRTHFFDGRDDQYKPPVDAQLNDPDDVARAVEFALGQPAGCELRELVIAPSTEPSWP